MSELKDLVSRAIQKSIKSGMISDEHQEELEKVALKMYEQGLSPREALGVTKDMLEGFYDHAYRLYQAAKYQEAMSLFILLQNIDMEDARFYLGQAACLHRMGHHANAAFIYEVASERNPEDPMPLYYASDCRLVMGEKKKALKHLKKVVSLGKQHPDYAEVVDRSKLMIDMLKMQLEESGELVEKKKKKKKV